MKNLILSIIFILTPKILALDSAESNLLLVQGTIIGKPELVKKALALGADVNFQDNDGDTALITALRQIHLKQFFFMTAYKNCEEIIEILIAHGAKIRIQNNAGKTAVDYINTPEISLLIPRSS